MSIVFIKEHNESVYHIQSSPDELLDQSKGIQERDNKNKVEEEHLQKTRQLGLVSKANYDHKHDGTHALMGIPKVSKPNPQNFLKKRTNNLLKTNFIRECCRKRKSLTKPPVPDTKLTVQEQDEKLRFNPPNIIARNIKKAIESKPKSPKRVIVVDHQGTKRNLSDAIEVTYINRKGFAKLPPYVSQLKMIKETKTLAAKSSKVQQPKCKYVVRDSRSRLLDGLKSNWEELQSQYQTLPILTDTIPKIHRKSHIENQLRQLEKDIVFLERHPYVYVYQDEEFLNQN